MKLLFDVHVTRDALAALRQLSPRLQAEHLAQWRGGAYRRAEDTDILAACYDEGRVFVTYDQRTIPGVLRQWDTTGRSHAGVFFADENTVNPQSPGLVAAAVAELAAEIGQADTTNLVRYLRRPNR